MTASAFLKVDKAEFYRFMATEPEGRFEFVRGRIMQQQQGGTQKHGRIAVNFLRALIDRLDPRVWIALLDRGVDTSETVRYADVVVEPASEPQTSVSTVKPVLIIEVLSRTSADRDLDVKPEEYLRLPSLAAYIVAGQDEAACYVWLRGGDGGFPSDPVTVEGIDKSIDIKALSLSIPLSEIYRGIALGAAPRRTT